MKSKMLSLTRYALLSSPFLALSLSHSLTLSLSPPLPSLSPFYTPFFPPHHPFFYLPLLSQGQQFEKKSLFSGFFSATSVMEKINPMALKDERFSCFTSLRNFPSVSSSDAISALVSSLPAYSFEGENFHRLNCPNSFGY